MKSPFPGIDPYLEQHWGDIHTSLMVYIRDQISDQLPGDLQARVEESVCVDLDETSRWIYPDVKVVESLEKNSGAGVALAEATIAEPILIPLPNEKPTQRHVEIVDLNSGNRVVTAIELLSPTNKKEDAGRNAYRRKQLDYIAAGVNLVEIDFIRTGSFIVAVPVDRIPQDMRTPYIVCVRRVQRPEHAEIIPIALDQTVPNFRRHGPLIYCEIANHDGGGCVDQARGISGTQDRWIGTNSREASVSMALKKSELYSSLWPSCDELRGSRTSNTVTPPAERTSTSPP